MHARSHPTGRGATVIWRHKNSVKMPSVKCPPASRHSPNSNPFRYAFCCRRPTCWVTACVGRSASGAGTAGRRGGRRLGGSPGTGGAVPAAANGGADAPEPQVNGYGMDKGWMGTSWEGGGGEGTVTYRQEPWGVGGGEGIVEATDESMQAAAARAAPLKVMVFIDGTWLYYSFFGRLGGVRDGGEGAGEERNVSRLFCVWFWFLVFCGEENRVLCWLYLFYLFIFGGG